jgi:hypothetical protein
MLTTGEEPLESPVQVKMLVCTPDLSRCVTCARRDVVNNRYVHGVYTSLKSCTSRGQWMQYKFHQFLRFQFEAYTSFFLPRSA